jgi:hypothetical protein
MPIKKDKKKKVIKPKKKSTKKKVAKPIVIITQKLPREKCCTDVTKTGEAYTIPFGFMNRLGAITEPKQTKSIGTSTSTSTETINKPLTIEQEVLKLLNESRAESNPITKYFKKQEPSMKKKQTPITKYYKIIPPGENIVISQEPPKEELQVKKPARNIQIVDEEEFNKVIEQEASAQPKQKRKYNKTKQEPRRNSIDDLNARYESLTGEKFVGNMKLKDFKKLVERMEQSSQ